MNAKPLAYDDGQRIHLLEVDRNALKDKVEAMVYELRPTDHGPHLKKDKVKFTLPSRLFGTVIHTRQKLLLDGFENSRLKSLGAMGIGQKGCGKTQQMEYVCNGAIARGYPVIVIRQPCTRQDIELAVKMCKPCVVFFDEYGKVYQDHEENSEKLKNELLTMFSDSSLGQVLFLLTDNSTRNFNDFILERPQRIRYRFDYQGCGTDVVKDICKVYKLPEDITKWVVEHAKSSNESIDGILAICEEGRNCKDVPSFVELFNILNVIKPRYSKVHVTADKDTLIAKVEDGKVHLEVDGEKQTFTIGKHPLVGKYANHEFQLGEVSGEIMVNEVTTDPGESYTITLGKYFKRNPPPW